MLGRTAGFAICLWLCSTASAQSYADDQLPTTERVAFSDLDLNSASGQKILRHRIQIAASEVCARTMEDVAVSRACYSAAYWDGIRQLDQLMAATKVSGTAAAAAIVVTAR